jgi:mRNA interferase RelE/StbE
MKKFALLERNPEAGAPLGGVLAGFRKLTVGNRDWRIIWRVTNDPSGVVVIDVAEVWAIGARAEGEVYEEMRARLATHPPMASLQGLEQMVELLEQRRGHLQPGGGHAAEDGDVLAEAWQVDDLVNRAGFDERTARALSHREASAAWAAFRRGQVEG